MITEMERINTYLERFTLDTYDRKSQVNPISSNPMGVNTKISNRTMKNINEFNKRLSATQISTLEGRIDEISETSSQVSSIPRQSGRDSGRRSSTWFIQPRDENYKFKSVRRSKWQKCFKCDLNSEYANKCICHFNVALDIFGCFNYILPSDIHSHQNTSFIQVYLTFNK